MVIDPQTIYLLGVQVLIELVMQHGTQISFLVENHCGILAYGTCEIRIKARRGLISVSGKELKMEFMTVSQLIITGKIQTVNFLEEGL